MAPLHVFRSIGDDWFIARDVEDAWRQFLECLEERDSDEAREAHARGLETTVSEFWMRIPDDLLLDLNVDVHGDPQPYSTSSNDKRVEKTAFEWAKDLGPRWLALDARDIRQGRRAPERVPGGIRKYREPTGDECRENAEVEVYTEKTAGGDRTVRGRAIWYPQMGGYVGKAVVVFHTPVNTAVSACFDAYVWHDGEWPLRGEEGREPVFLHHCDPEQFTRFGQRISAFFAESSKGSTEAS